MSMMRTAHTAKYDLIGCRRVIEKIQLTSASITVETVQFLFHGANVWAIMSGRRLVKYKISHVPD